MSLWNLFLKQPLANLLFFFYQALSFNLGLAIIATAASIGLGLIPLTLPSLRSSQKMQKIKPELDSLLKKYKHDKQLLAAKQLELYKKHQINPAAGIFPMIIRLLVIIALYGVLNQVIAQGGDANQINNFLYPAIKLPPNTQLNTRFLYLDILRPDLINFKTPLNLFLFKVSSLPGFFLIGSALLQFAQTQLMRKNSPTASGQPKTAKPNQDGAQMAETMQKQMAFIMPLMTILIGYRLASGLVISWFVFSLASLAQQLYLQKLIKDNKAD